MFRSIVLMVLAALSVACNRTPNNAAPQSLFDPVVTAKGRDLYQANCAECHGPRAQGHPDWQTPNDGTFSAAPPLNGTGNEHLRSKSQLIATIKNGVSHDGIDVMPAWGTRLSDSDIDATLAWLQSLWPADTYQTWLKAQTSAPAVPAGPPHPQSSTNPQ